METSYDELLTSPPKPVNIRRVHWDGSFAASKISSMRYDFPYAVKDFRGKELGRFTYEDQANEFSNFWGMVASYKHLDKHCESVEHDLEDAMDEISCLESSLEEARNETFNADSELEIAREQLYDEEQKVAELYDELAELSGD